VRTGYEHRTARRSLNLLTIEWANRGINLWTIEQGSIPMVQGQIVYTLPEDTIDLLDQVIRTQSGVNQTDINISRISVSTYATIPNKNTQGRPIQVWIDRQSGATEAYRSCFPRDLCLAYARSGNTCKSFLHFCLLALKEDSRCR
jgi:hypothetical protein